MKKGLIIILSLVLAGLICLFGILYFKDRNPSENDKPSSSQSDKGNEKEQDDKLEITVSVALEDDTREVFEISTTAKTLADALLEEKLITKDEYESGFYTLLNGIRADYSQDGYWWCFKVNGEDAMVSANEIILKDGDSFEIVRTPA